MDTNQQLTKKTEYIFFLIVGSGGIILSTLSLFGFLTKLPWLKAQIPTLSLFFISVIIIKLLNEKINFCENIVSDLSKMQKGQLDKIEYMVDPKLRHVFGKEIKGYIKSLDLAINKKQIIFNDIAVFRFFYKLALEKYTFSTFLATSIPSKNYFWKNKLTEDSMKNFITNGGSLKRIYFLDCELADANKEILDILKFQLNIGIEVYIVANERVPKDLRRFFALESTQQIGWEVHAGPKNEINQVIVSSDHDVIDEFSYLFARICELHDTKKISMQVINNLANTNKS